jgi:hypothetical protein
MAKQYRAKFITRLHDIIKDYNLPHYPDLVMHSKALITMLVTLALKHQDAAWDFRSGRNITYEQKLEHLFDSNMISEEVYDNCINTISLRNPIEHIYTYPNEFFAKGAAASALAMYFSLQVPLDLPHIPRLEPVREALKAQPTYLLHFKLSRLFQEGEYAQIDSILKSNPGGYTVMMEFPAGSHFQGKPLTNMQLDIKVGYSEIIPTSLTSLGVVESAMWAGLEIFPAYPHNMEYNREQYPGLFPQSQ